jgi:glycosyltransferase involved in cell wall biosynthesis
MNKVLVVFSSDVPGGAEISLSRMALASFDVSYDLCTLGRYKDWARWLKSQGGNPIILGNSDSGFKRPSFIIAMFNLIKRFMNIHYDAVYVCGTRSAFVLRFILLFFPRTKFVHAIRWNPNTSFLRDRILRIVERWTGFLVDKWICNSESAKKTLTEKCGISSERIIVIYNGVEYPETIIDITSRSNTVLTVANVSERKGYIDYLNTIEKVHLVMPTVEFIFVGRDDMNGKLQVEIKKMGLDGVVRYDGYQKDLSLLYSSASIFVLPSKSSEGCPTSILEAHSFGVPVIAYKVDGIPEIVDDSVDGYLYDIDNQAMHQGILNLISNPLLIESMGAQGRNKVKHKFTVEACANYHTDAFLLICQ